MNENDISNHDLPLIHALSAVLICTAFGASTVAVKISLAGIGIFTTAAIRFTLASVVITLWAWLTRRPFGIKKGQMPQIIIKSLFYAVQLSFFYFGMSKTLATRGSLIINLQPFFLLFMAHFFIPGDRITIRKIVGVIMGFSGVALIFLDKQGVTSDLRLGDVLLLIGTIIWAGNMIYTKRIIHNFRPFHLVLYPMVLTIPLFFIAGYIFDGRMIFNLTGSVIAALLYQGLVSTSFGFVAWNGLLQRYGAVALHSFVFIMPIAGVFLSGLLLGEDITANIISALLLITAGILVVHLRPRYLTVFPFRRGGDMT